MQAYKLTQNPGIIVRTSDAANIPASPDNIDYQAYLAWVAAGNMPQTYDPDPAVDPKEQAKAELAASDKEMARIAEDLINILLNKGLISTSELTGQAVSKLNDRANLRKLL